MDDKPDNFKREVMEQIQAEYIAMCKEESKILKVQSKDLSLYMSNLRMQGCINSFDKEGEMYVGT